MGNFPTTSYLVFLPVPGHLGLRSKWQGQGYFLTVLCAYRKGIEQELSMRLFRERAAIEPLISGFQFNRTFSWSAQNSRLGYICLLGRGLKNMQHRKLSAAVTGTFVSVIFTNNIVKLGVSAFLAGSAALLTCLLPGYQLLHLQRSKLSDRVEYKLRLHDWFEITMMNT
jgi:hypothetical protein